jgi:hypothetical protein
MHKVSMFTTGVAISMILAGVPNNVSAMSWYDAPVDVTFQEEHIDDVLQQIHEQTGITILYDQSMAGEMVTGSYRTSALNAVRRLFSEKNIVVQMDNASRALVVRGFGAKELTMIGAPSSIRTVADLSALHASQQSEINKKIADESRFVAEGFTIGQLREMHRKQFEEHEKVKEAGIEELAENFTQTDLRLLHQQQEHDISRKLEDLDREVSEGVTVGQVRALHKRQFDIFSKQVADGEAVVDQETGMTRSELRDLHKAQQAEINKRSKDRNRPISGV